MKIKYFFPSIISVFTSFFVLGQIGITGTVIDGDFNEALPFANILLKETGEGVTSDFDGKYSFELEEGIYTLQFSFVGYETKVITEIQVTGNEFTITDVVLNSAAQGLEEVILTVDAGRNTEASVLQIQKKSASLLDGISAQAFKKIGASDIAGAVKNVPGVSVQGGKYVYVRGLGDRYTKSILNGVDIPGLDPDRNTIQMDLFPTNMLSNVLVIKSARADLPADFTGGVIDIITKDFPSKEEFSVSLTMGYNPDMHFNDNYLTYAGGSTDFLGFDDGSRKNKIANSFLGNAFDPRLNPTESTLNVVNRISNQFDPQMAPKVSNSGMNFGFGISYGNQFNFENGHALGVLASLSYKSEQTVYENTQDNLYNFSPEKSVFTFEENRIQSGTIGGQNIISSGLFGLTYKTESSKYKFNGLHIQNGESTSGSFRQLTRFSDFIDFNKFNLEYNERSISNAMFSGLHNFDESNLKLEWTLSGTLAKVHDKDVRNTTFQDEEGIFSFQENTEPKRIWRTLDENNLVAKVDFTKRFEFLGSDAVLKFGIYGSFKERDFSIAQYSVSSNYTSKSDWDNYGGDPNQLFNPNNLIGINNDKGTYINPQTTIRQEANIFNAKQQNLAGYVSNEFNFSEELKSIIGLRFENYQVFYTGENSQLGEVYNNENIISKNNLFPSVNFIYSLKENKNLRLAYSLTTARPSFKEASIAEIYDPISNLFFIGNINIRPTYIDNFDIRYEAFGENAQLFAISAFYKNLTDPIEIGFVAASFSNYKPLNLETANVFGLELELRKDLSTWFSGFENWKLNFNGSYIISDEKYSEDELKLRRLGLREGQNLGSSRPLQGQSPYLINAGIEYNNQDKGFQGGLFYNVQGKTLQVVGNGFYPDVYTMPFNSLNFNVIKQLKKNRTLTLKVTNLLDDNRESDFIGFNEERAYFSFRNIGRTFSFSYAVRF
ncbi:MAG: TonB-dependent receptor [Flavobacteriaceae bacterium]|jgi:TonB-dependent receptor|nr:TonB-dependent receptor [Flavobacteriaceae bacterium]MDG1941032.1 TonB-dependent receptor [Flavobacteriaceae bacterium]